MEITNMVLVVWREALPLNYGSCRDGIYAVAQIRQRHLLPVRARRLFTSRTIKGRDGRLFRYVGKM